MFRRTPKQPPLSRDAALASRPVRTADAQLVLDEKTGGGKLVVKLADRKWGLFKLPVGATKTFELDEVGVSVWNRLDGRTSVETLMRDLAKQYHLDLRQAEASTIAFLQMLMKRGLVGLTRDET